MVFKQLLGSRIIVEPTPETEEVKSGIVIVKTERQRPETGQVIQVGPGSADNPMTLTAGDNILFRRGAGEDISIKDKSYLIMLESDVQAVI